MPPESPNYDFYPIVSPRKSKTANNWIITRRSWGKRRLATSWTLSCWQEIDC